NSVRPMIRNRALTFYLCAGATGLAQTTTPAGDAAWSIHFQATSIGQEHGAFPALYTTLALFAYIAAAFLAHPDWHAVMRATVIPRVERTSCRHVPGHHSPARGSVNQTCTPLRRL